MMVMVVTFSEPLGLEQRIDEVDHQPHGDEAGERIVENHGKASSESIADNRVADRQREKADGGGHQDDVQHVGAPSNARFSARSRWLFARRSFDVSQETHDLRFVDAQLPATDGIGIREGCEGNGIGIS